MQILATRRNEISAEKQVHFLKKHSVLGLAAFNARKTSVI